MKLKNMLFGVILLAPMVTVRAQLARMPFEFNGKHMYIKVGVGSNDSLRFVFDTGATNASIDSLAAEKAGVSKADREVVQAAGHGGVRAYVMAKKLVLKVAGLEVAGVNPMLVDFSEMSRATGMKLEGLIGYELLARYVTAVDFESSQLSFYKNITQVDTTGYTGIPFEFNKGILIPRFPASIRLKTGEVFTGRVMFDSGGFFTLLVSTPFNKFHQLSAHLPERTLVQSRGLNAVTDQEQAVIAGMTFGGFDLGEMPIDLTVNSQAEPKDGYLGMIGSTIIQRFNLIFDYPNGKIYMKPNASHRSPFVLDTVVKLKDLTSESESFLNSNRIRPGVKVTPSGLQYQVVKAGKGPKPLASDKVKIYYNLSLADGTAIWKPFNRNRPWIHRIDKALAGMQEALLMMPVGSKWKIYMPAELAFGLEGYEEIPKGAAVVAEVELVDIINN